MTDEQLAGWFEELDSLRRARWLLIWAEWDAARRLEDEHGEYGLRLVASELGTNWRLLKRWADRARAVPVEDRRPEYAPISHVI